MKNRHGHGLHHQLGLPLKTAVQLPKKIVLSDDFHVNVLQQTLNQALRVSPRFLGGERIGLSYSRHSMRLVDVTYILCPSKSPTNAGIQEIFNRTHWTDPEKTWVSNSSIATYLVRGPLGFGPIQFLMEGIFIQYLIWVYKSLKKNPQMLNVWPIYLHLGSFGGKCR